MCRDKAAAAEGLDAAQREDRRRLLTHYKGTKCECVTWSMESFSLGG